MLTLVLAGIISVISSLTEVHESNQKRIAYIIRVFFIAGITIYFGLQFLTEDCNIPEINTGDPPF